MSEEKKSKASEINDALASHRKEEPPQSPEPNQEAPLLTDAEAMAMGQDAQERFGDLPMQDEPMMLTHPKNTSNSGPNTVKITQTDPAEETTPVPSTSPPPVTETSTPELPETNKPNETIKEVILQGKLLAFVNSDSFSPNWVGQQLLLIVDSSAVLPSPNLWDMPPMANLPMLIRDIVRAEGYVEARWAALKVMMANSIDNTEWVAGVLCFLAISDAVRVLGRVKDELRNF